MILTDKISIIIPYKPDHGRRDFLWPFIQMRYREYMPDIEICMGSDDQNKLFCKARAINEAVQKATGEILILVDAEVIFEPSLIEQIRSIIHFHPWIIPFANAFRLNKEATDRFIEECLSLDFCIGKSDIEYSKFVPGGYMNVLTRESFDKVRGMDERFKGYGFEDMAFALSLDTICGPHYRMDGTIFHLWHPWAEFIHPNYQISVDLFRRYETAAGNIEAMKSLIHERQVIH